MDNLSDLHVICLKVFDSVREPVSLFVLPLFLTRVVFAAAMGNGHYIFSSLKGVVAYFLLIAGFPYILDLLFAIPESFLPTASHIQSISAEKLPASVSLTPFLLDRIIELILSSLYWIVYYLHVFFMTLMSAMAPLVFLLGSLLGLGLGIEVFLGLLIIGSSWPVIWYGFDQVHDMLIHITTDSFAKSCLEILVTLMKGLSPVAFASLAVKSPAGRAVSGAARGAVMATKMVVAQAPVAAGMMARPKVVSVNSGESRRGNSGERGGVISYSAQNMNRMERYQQEQTK